ncbi:MAG: DUF4290 domain-containing protein [Bacteroidales bacterium]|nr:DUF4290 domain-containing protein [Bacteroidales bacterium]
MEYNTLRSKLIMPEYGRNIQKMAEFCRSLEDRQQRNAAAKQCVKAMMQVKQAESGSSNFYRKIWEHFFMIAGWDLDIDCPVKVEPNLQKEVIKSRFTYSDGKIKNRTYGKFLPEMLKQTAWMLEGEEKKALKERSANMLKRMEYESCGTVRDDEQLKRVFYLLSGGEMDLDEDFVFKTVKQLQGKQKAAKPVSKKAAKNKKK